MARHDHILCLQNENFIQHLSRKMWRTETTWET